MPIKNLKPILAEAGKIKIGGLGKPIKSRSGKEFRPPVKYDEFLITTTQRNRVGDLIPDERLMKMLKNGKEKLRQIPILLHSDDLEEVFPTCYACYKGRQLYCRGDGERATRWEIKDSKRTGKSKSIHCPCKLLEDRKCKPHGTLNVMIRAEQHAVAGAVHKFRTTSWNSIKRTLASLQQIKGLFGTLRGVPLRLKLDAIKVKPKDQHQKTVYCAYVECAAEDFASVQQRVLASARMTAETRALYAGTPPPPGYKDAIDVPASEKESSGEQARVGAEFHPEPYDPETGEVLTVDGPDPHEPPDPEPDGEESPFDPNEGGPNAEVSTLPKNHPKRQVIIDLVVEVSAMRLSLTGATSSDDDWNDKHKAAKLELWEATCQDALGNVPEGEPEVTEADVDTMRGFLKRQKLDILLEDLSIRMLDAQDFDRDAKDWETHLQTTRKENWAELCELVFRAQVEIGAKLDEASSDKIIEALRQAIEKHAQLSAGDDDGGEKRQDE